MSYIIDLDSRVAGIPCIVRVKSFHKQQGSYNREAASDMDFYGYTESDWELLDRRGRKADWLTNKLKADDVERIESEIERALT